MAQSSYYADKTRKDRENAKEVAERCPVTVNEFRIARDASIAASSMRSYIYDLYEFFLWWQTANPDLKDTALTDISIEDISHITAQDINEYFADRRLTENGPSAGTRYARMYSSLNAYFTYLYKYGQIADNPMNNVERAKIPKKKTIVRLKEDEPDRLIRLIRNGYAGQSAHERALREEYIDRDVAIVSLLLTTGIRVSECAGINIRDINFDHHTLTVTRKGGFKQYLALGEIAETSLLAYLSRRKHIAPADADSEDALFLTRQKARMKESAIRRLVEKYCAELGLDRKITPHSLRKTYGTNLYQASGNIYLVASALGHSSVNTTTQHYVATAEEDLQYVRDIVPLTKKEE